MGTLSYAYGKPFGYHSVPGTCRWCGEKLIRERYLDPAAPLDRTLYPAGGYGGNGKFCSLRCGYQWAVRCADYVPVGRN